MRVHLMVDIPDDTLNVFLREVGDTRGEPISLSVGHHSFFARLIDANSGALAAIAFGNPFDGMRLIGPFPSQDAELVEYAERHGLGDWWIADLHAPENG